MQRNGRFWLVPHRPRRRAVMLLLLAAAIIAVGAFGYWYGKSRVHLDSQYLRALILRDRVSGEQMQDLRRQLADAELARTVDQQAAQSLRDTVTSLRDEIAQLRQEAALYRNMIDPRAKGKGLSVATLEINPAETPGRFQYFVLLTRSEVEGDPATGTLEFSVTGSNLGAGSRTREIALKDMAALEDYPLPFRFRYLQGFSGELTLPEDFEPKKVLLRLSERGRKDAQREMFDWRPEEG